jgi:hypothetical protein
MTKSIHVNLLQIDELNKSKANDLKLIKKVANMYLVLLKGMQQLYQKVSLPK